MEPQKRLNQLCSLRDEIATLRIVKCRMSHERVVRDGESGLPVMRLFPEGSYERVGLCTSELRAKRLGCSHSSARIRLVDAINELGASGAENNASSLLLSKELAWLDNAIHLLDHRKGDAEKKLAGVVAEVHGAVEQGDNREKVREAENEIREMEQLHDEYVERIGRLRDRVVVEIDKLLGEQALTNERARVAACKEAEKVKQPETA